MAVLLSGQLSLDPRPESVVPCFSMLENEERQLKPEPQTHPNPNPFSFPGNPGHHSSLSGNFSHENLAHTVASGAEASGESLSGASQPEQVSLVKPLLTLGHSLDLDLDPDSRPSQAPTRAFLVFHPDATVHLYERAHMTAGDVLADFPNHALTLLPGPASPTLSFVPFKANATAEPDGCASGALSDRRPLPSWPPASSRGLTLLPDSALLPHNTYYLQPHAGALASTSAGPGADVARAPRPPRRGLSCQIPRSIIEECVGPLSCSGHTGRGGDSDVPEPEQADQEQGSRAATQATEPRGPGSTQPKRSTFPGPRVVYAQQLSSAPGKSPPGALECAPAQVPRFQDARKQSSSISGASMADAVAAFGVERPGRPPPRTEELLCASKCEEAVGTPTEATCTQVPLYHFLALPGWERPKVSPDERPAPVEKRPPPVEESTEEAGPAVTPGLPCQAPGLGGLALPASHRALRRLSSEMSPGTEYSSQSVGAALPAECGQRCRTPPFLGAVLPCRLQPVERVTTWDADGGGGAGGSLRMEKERILQDLQELLRVNSLRGAVRGHKSSWTNEAGLGSTTQAGVPAGGHGTRLSAELAEMDAQWAADDEAEKAKSGQGKVEIWVAEGGREGSRCPHLVSREGVFMNPFNLLFRVSGIFSWRKAKQQQRGLRKCRSQQFRTGEEMTEFASSREQGSLRRQEDVLSDVVCVGSNQLLEKDKATRSFPAVSHLTCVGGRDMVAC